jgi:hypothetical protein
MGWLVEVVVRELRPLLPTVLPTVGVVRSAELVVPFHEPACQVVELKLLEMLPDPASVGSVESRTELAVDNTSGVVVKAVAANVELEADDAPFDVELFQDISVEIFDGTIDRSLELIDAEVLEALGLEMLEAIDVEPFEGNEVMMVAELVSDG